MINFKKDMIPDLDYLLELYYHKILRVNLTTDSYEVIKMLPFEEDPKTSSSDWLAMFGSSNVADEDWARFTKYTDLTFMRENIGEIPINFRYKRKFPHDKFYNSEFILLPSIDYKENNQICYMFIKESELLD